MYCMHPVGNKPTISPVILSFVLQISHCMLCHLYLPFSPLLLPVVLPNVSFLFTCSLQTSINSAFFLLCPVHPQYLLYSHFWCLSVSPPLPLFSGYVGHVADQSSLISPPPFSLCATYESSCDKSEGRKCNGFEYSVSCSFKHEKLAFMSVCTCARAVL